MLAIAADGVKPTPWKNGGGKTRDLLCDALDWRWRISLADIDVDGAFSVYAGVQRWFTVVEGSGVALAFGARVVTLRVNGAPVAFDGADAPHCRLLDGPTRDLNLMLRGGARGCMQRGNALGGDWPLAGRYDVATRVLHWDLPPHERRAATPQLWIAVAP